MCMVKVDLPLSFLVIFVASSSTPHENSRIHTIKSPSENQ